jgi:hypothetical protein
MSWIWWIIGTLGIGGALLAGAILVFGWPVIIGTRMGRAALAVGAGALAVLGVFLKGKQEGRAAEREKLRKLTEKEVKNAAAERKRIAALTDEQVDAELAKWGK